VGSAVQLLYITLIIGLIRAPLEAPGGVGTTPAPLTFVLVVGVLTFAVGWFFIYRISHGANWARVTLFVLFILGMPLYLLFLIQSFRTSPLSAFLAIGQAVLQLVGLVMLFGRESSAWFRACKKRA